MKKVGLLVSEQDYYLPYLEWAESCRLFKLIGINTTRTDRFSMPCVSHDWIFDNSDLVFSFGFGKKISKDIIDKIPLGIVNVHHSYRLRYRGRHGCSWSIINGEEHHGSSIHYMNENIDDGPIIDTKKTKIEDYDTAETLFEKVNRAGLELLQDNIETILQGKVDFKEADPNYYTYKTKDLNHDITSVLEFPLKLYKYIRALTYRGKPSPFVIIKGQKVFLSLEE